MSSVVWPVIIIFFVIIIIAIACHSSDCGSREARDCGAGGRRHHRHSAGDNLTHAKKKRKPCGCHVLVACSCKTNKQTSGIWSLSTPSSCTTKPKKCDGTKLEGCATKLVERCKSETLCKWELCKGEVGYLDLEIVGKDEKTTSSIRVDGISKAFQNQDGTIELLNPETYDLDGGLPCDWNEEFGDLNAEVELVVEGTSLCLNVTMNHDSHNTLWFVQSCFTKL